MYLLCTVLLSGTMVLSKASVYGSLRQHNYWPCFLGERGGIPLTLINPNNANLSDIC